MDEPTITISQEKVNTVLDKVLRFGLLAVVFLLPLVMAPVTSDWFEMNKQLFLTVSVSLLSAIYVLRALITRRFSLSRSIFDLPIVLLTLVTLISNLLTPNRLLDLTTQAVPALTLFLLFFLIANNFSTEDDVRSLLITLVAAAALVSVFPILQFFVYLAGRLPSPSLNQAISGLTTQFPFFLPTFSLTGTLFTQAFFLVILLPLVLGLIYQARKNNSAAAVANYSVLLALLSVALLSTLYQLFINRPVFLDLESSWKIATGSIGQSLLTAFFGMGPGNYVDAFSAYRPVNLNMTPFWSLRFGAAADYYLFLLTGLGIAGLAAFLLLVQKVFRAVKIRALGGSASPEETGLLASLSLVLVLMLVFPAPSLILFMLFVLLAALAVYYKSRGAGAFAGDYDWLTKVPAPATYLAALILLALAGALIYAGGRVYLADYYFAQAAKAAQNNQGTQTYNLQIKALELNPWNDAYRVAYSQTNLALADSLAGQIASPSSGTDQQKATIIQLVQQAIREGRNAVALNPRRSTNWENLGAIYRNLINFAQGADQWAIASLNQAIVADPNNPRLRLELGNIYFALGNYQGAAQAFAAAVNLKPDYVAAHYSLAQAAKLANDNNLAVQELTTITSLICNTGAPTADCQKVRGELADLQKPAAAAPAPTPTPAAPPTEQVATPGGAPSNLPKAKTQPPAVISSPSGELRQLAPTVTPAP